MTLNFSITHLRMENLNSLDQNQNTGGPPLFNTNIWENMETVHKTALQVDFLILLTVG